MPKLPHRITALATALLVVGAAFGIRPAPVSAADLTIGQAETEVLRLLNVDRTAAGLVRVRADGRLMAIARARSVDMATKDYFSHTQPDGRSVFDIIASAGITWYGAGEIIAWNNWPTLADSATVANRGWMNSTGHRNIILSASYNYVGVGLAVDQASGKKYWTAVFMRGPDRTGGWVALRAPRWTDTTGSDRTVVVSWRGNDTLLSALTAGFRNYQVQRRTDAGRWSWLSSSTTATSRTLLVHPGHAYDLRIRACDKLGNCGGWQTQTIRP